MNFVKPTVLFGACAFFQIGAAQDSEETITHELRFDSNSAKNLLHVQNVNGSIDIEGYNGTTIQVEVKKKIWARSRDMVALGKEEIGVAIERKAGEFFVFLDSPWTYFALDKGRFSHRENYNYNDRPKYRYHLDFKIKVPKNVGLQVGTMNDGDIHIKDVQGHLMRVNNLNGAITLENIAGKTDVNALNRNIDISYYRNPTEDCSYHSLNGDINVVFKDDLNADVSFKSMNGDLYTNYDVSMTQTKISQKEVGRRKGVKYKVDSNESFRIGKGGVQLDFNLLNGDAFVKK